MMNLTNLDKINDSNEIIRRLSKRDLTENEFNQANRINEFLSQNKLNHQLNSKATTSDNIAFVFFVTLFLVMSSMVIVF